MMVPLGGGGSFNVSASVRMLPRAVAASRKRRLG